jgi:hypothetical protein
MGTRKKAKRVKEPRAPIITPKQKLFIEEYLVDMNATQAYYRAGYKATNPNTATVCAGQLMSKPHIAQAIADAFASRIGRVRFTQDKVLNDIEEERLLARGAGQHAVAMKGCELTGRYLRMFTDKVEHSGDVTLNIMTGVPERDE